MSVGFKIQLHSGFLFATLGRCFLRRIQDIGTTFLLGFLDAIDVLPDVLLKESKRGRSLRQNLKRLEKSDPFLIDQA